jgi:hypothetical protein
VAAEGGGAVSRRIAALDNVTLPLGWDETFMELTLDDVRDSICRAARSRRKRFEEQTILLNDRGERITITVRKEQQEEDEA